MLQESLEKKSSFLFNKSKPREIGGVEMHVRRVVLDQFDDALEVGKWLQGLDQSLRGTEIIPALESLQSSSPTRQALERLIAGSLSIEPTGETLTVADVRSMPIPTVAEAIAVLLEENLDFFFQTLPKLLEAQKRITSIGSASPSSSSAQVTPATESAATR